MTKCKNIRCKRQSMSSCLLKKDPSTCLANKAFSKLIDDITEDKPSKKKKPTLSEASFLIKQ